MKNLLVLAVLVAVQPVDAANKDSLATFEVEWTVVQSGTYLVARAYHRYGVVDVVRDMLTTTVSLPNSDPNIFEILSRRYQVFEAAIDGAIADTAAREQIKLALRILIDTRQTQAQVCSWNFYNAWPVK